MELWIRSQDKEKLVLTKGFEIQHTNYDGGCQIFAVWQNNYQMVGKYKNKERALEVLDEIQNILQPRLIAKIRPSEGMEELMGGRCFNKTKSMKADLEFKELSTCVYEMPKE